MFQLFQRFPEISSVHLCESELRGPTLPAELLCRAQVAKTWPGPRSAENGGEGAPCASADMTSKDMCQTMSNIFLIIFLSCFYIFLYLSTSFLSTLQQEAQVFTTCSIKNQYICLAYAGLLLQPQCHHMSSWVINIPIARLIWCRRWCAMFGVRIESTSMLVATRQLFRASHQHLW